MEVEMILHKQNNVGLNEFEDSIVTRTEYSTWRNQKFRVATKHVTYFSNKNTRHPFHRKISISTFRSPRPRFAPLTRISCEFAPSADSFDALSVPSRMRLTIPRWASAVSETTGKPGHAVVDRVRALTNHDRKRRDVINPDLCKEALELLRPSLPPLSSCDIIDINPGVGIWSQHLHQVLKPRRHVFVETEYHNYEEALAPLLQQDQSTYRLAPNISDALDENQDFLSPELRGRYASLDSEARTATRECLTPQLIITANLAQKTVRSNGFQGAMSKLFLEHFYRNTAMGTGAFPWHKYGLVRLLAWIPEGDKMSFSPRCASYRYRSAKQLEASCRITEIVSSFPNDGILSQHRPWHGAELESAREVAAIQSASKLEIPEYRQQPLPKPPSNFLIPSESNFPLLRSIPDKPPLVDEFITAYKEIKSSHPQWLNGYLKTFRVGHEERIQDKSDPREKFARLRSRMSTAHRHHVKVEDLARAQIEIERQLIAIRRGDPGDIAGYRKLLNRVIPELEAIKSKQAALFKDNRHAVKKAVDDYRALNHSPYLLHWHNRRFEPLLCRPKKDFFPHMAMSLLEITPRVEFIQKVNTADRQIVFDYLSHILDFVRIRSVKESLELLVGSGHAYEQFVGKFGEPGGIPSLTDPLYGGSHDLDDFRLRTMSVNQFIDIVLAYEAWPWRMSLNDMIESVSTFGSTRIIT